MDKKEQFDIPIVLLIFKRKDALIKIINKIREISPSKIYILSDGGRNEKENSEIKECRKIVEKQIDWECEIIKKYSETNIGVYENIGLGAMWVFNQEKYAIFLEDDNLPEVSFFKFCREMLKKYENEEQVLWICGTNYLGEYENKYSYVFTHNLLPCGWASWADKFLKYYDYNFDKVITKQVKKEMLKTYQNKALFTQEIENIERELKRKMLKEKYFSWDYHMIYSIRVNNLYGICPIKNQIKNIGVDEFSIHGGSSHKNKMVENLCSMDSYELSFPLIDPPKIEINKNFENLIEKKILFPLDIRVKRTIKKILKRLKIYE